MIRLSFILLLYSSTALAGVSDKVVYFIGADSATKGEDINDTVYKPITLKKELAGKTIEYNPGTNATIYIQWVDARALCQGSNSRKEEYDSLASRLDYLDKKVKTIKVSDGSFGVMNYIVSDLLRQGKAKVYDNVSGHYLDSVTCRLERFGSEADRVFYLPEGIPFFAVQEYSGIQNGTASPWSTNEKDYPKLYDMLRTIGSAKSF